MTNEVMAGLGEVGAMDRSDEALGVPDGACSQNRD